MACPVHGAPSGRDRRWTRLARPGWDGPAIGCDPGDLGRGPVRPTSRSLFASATAWSRAACGGDLVEQRRLDRLADDVVDIGLVRDGRDDVLVRRDGVLRETAGAVLDGRRRRREERVVVRRRRRRVDRDLLGELDHAPRVREELRERDGRVRELGVLLDRDRHQALARDAGLAERRGDHAEVAVQGGVGVLDLAGQVGTGGVERRGAGREGVEADPVIAGQDGRVERPGACSCRRTSAATPRPRAS